MGIKIAAMILAGGKGTRLKALTRKTAVSGSDPAGGRKADRRWTNSFREVFRK